MEYSRDEVIKALDHCIHLNGVSSLDNNDECFDCPFRADGEDTCVSLAPMLEAALELLKEQEPRWISVEDRLPELGDTVLFTGKSSFGTRFATQRGWWDGTFWHRDAGETIYSSTPVTHWMPLPSTEGLDETV